MAFAERDEVIYHSVHPLSPRQMFFHYDFEYTEDGFKYDFSIN